MSASPCQYWNVTPEEVAARYPCEEFADTPHVKYLRGVTVRADSETVFRWVCQLKEAPYSYDWIDNRGRQSPRRLTPGADDLAKGQLFMIARIVAFERGRHITSVTTPRAARIFGPIAMTYDVRPATPGVSRLVVCMAIGAHSPSRRLLRGILGCGDLVMMRKQLLNLKERAESSVAA